METKIKAYKIPKVSINYTNSGAQNVGKLLADLLVCKSISIGGQTRKLCAAWRSLPNDDLAVTAL